MKADRPRLARLRELFSLAVFAAVYLPARLLVSGCRGLAGLVGLEARLPALHSRFGVRGRVLYLEPSPPEGSGYEYRTRRWAPVLEDHGLEPTAAFALTGSRTEALLGRGWIGLFLALYLVKRFGQVLRAPLYNVVVVRRELLLFDDYGGLFLERLLLALNPRVILDFDDDIAASKREPRAIGIVGRFLAESPTKFTDSLGLYPAFIAGSPYLAELARSAPRADGAPPPRITVVPTCVNADELPVKSYRPPPDRLTLGWIGTNGNLPQLERIVPELEQLAAEMPVRLLVIAGRDVRLTTPLTIENRRWSLETQVADLLDIDIGLMPLVDTPRERGKCGFKLLQYMAVGIVGVATALTTNIEIVTDRVDGFLVAPGGSWLEALREVAADRERFAEIGAAARRTVQARYSFQANAETYLSGITGEAGA